MKVWPSHTPLGLLKSEKTIPHMETPYCNPATIGTMATIRTQSNIVPTTRTGAIRALQCFIWGRGNNGQTVRVEVFHTYHILLAHGLISTFTPRLPQTQCTCHIIQILSCALGSIEEFLFWMCLTSPA